MANLMLVPSHDQIPPTGAITQDILTKKRDVLLKEHVARGLPVDEKKTAKVMRTERIMFELRVPWHLQATMMDKLNAADMGETKCKVQTLRDYLVAAGEQVDPSALKITCITAIFQYWVRSPDLNGVDPIGISKLYGEPAPEHTLRLSPLRQSDTLSLPPLRQSDALSLSPLRQSVQLSPSLAKITDPEELRNMERMEQHLDTMGPRQPVGQPSSALGSSDRFDLEGLGAEPAHFTNPFKKNFSEPLWLHTLPSTEPDEQAVLQNTLQARTQSRQASPQAALQAPHHTHQAVPQAAHHQAALQAPHHTHQAVPQAAHHQAALQAPHHTHQAVPQAAHHQAALQAPHHTHQAVPQASHILGRKSSFADNSSFSPRGSFRSGPPSRLSTPKHLPPGSTSSRAAGSLADNAPDSPDQFAAEIQQAYNWWTDAGYDSPATISNIIRLAESIDALELLHARLIAQYQCANRTVAQELRTQAIRKLEGYQLSPTRQQHIEKLKETRKGFLNLRSDLDDVILKAEECFYRMYEDLDPSGEL
ncbi:hypothetical protein EV127DRAFT_132887 [Xylaria flabelliformis]|nr:hypothetical protein EV127DRAFT_132887 [Xylaria flabelliformis]